MKQKEENIENSLGDHGKNQPFRVPEGYFETFADRLKVRIEKEEEEQPDKKRSLLFNLRPVLMIAASFAIIMLLIYIPSKKYTPANDGYVSRQLSNKDSIDNDVTPVPVDLFTYFSEGQFLSAISDMKEIEDETLSNDSLGDYIAANYNDFEIIANN